MHQLMHMKLLKEKSVFSKRLYGKKHQWYLVNIYKPFTNVKLSPHFKTSYKY